MTHATYTLVTGASTGLGKELAIQCARMGMNLVLVALPGGNTTSIAQDLTREYGVDVRVYEFDLTDAEEVKRKIEEITAVCDIDFLINNAGMGGTSPITETPLESIDRIIQLNVRGTVHVTRLLIPHLLKHSRSYIMNISSMAAFTPIAYKTVYPASKAFISSFSLGLREELADSGVSVSVVYPGPILTNSLTARRIIAQGVKGKMGLLPTAKIAAIALRQTLAGRPGVIPGFINRMNHILMTLLPQALKLKIVSRAVKKEITFALPA